MARTQKKKKPAGVGDVIAQVAASVGIKPCKSCEERRHILNVAFPFNTPKTLTCEQIDTIEAGASDEQYIEIYRDAWSSDIDKDTALLIIGTIKKKVDKLHRFLVGE